MGLKVASFLLLLLIVTCGAAQGQGSDFVVLDLQATEAGDVSPMYKEQIALTKIPVTLGRSRHSPLCSACENITKEAVDFLSEKQIQDKIMAILEDTCSQTFSFKQQCLEMVDSYATLFFAKIGEIKPDEFCKQYGLCRDMALLSAVKSESTCVFCHHIMDEVMSKLKDPDAEFEIIQLLLKECNKIEGHQQQCKRMVLQYVPLVLVNGEKFLEKNDVCAIIQACDAGKKTTFSISSRKLRASLLLSIQSSISGVWAYSDNQNATAVKICNIIAIDLLTASPKKKLCGEVTLDLAASPKKFGAEVALFSSSRFAGTGRTSTESTLRFVAAMTRRLRLRVRVEAAVASVVAVLPHEISPLISAASTFFFILSSYFAVLPLRDEGAISLGLGTLPGLFAGSLLLTLLAAPVASLAFSLPSIPKPRALVFIHRFFSLSLLVFFVLWFASTPGHSASISQVSLLNLITISSTWARVIDVMDSESGSRLFGFIGAGATLGQLFGSLFAATMAWLGPCFWLIARSPYLMYISLFLWLGAVVSSFFYFQGRILTIAGVTVAICASPFIATLNMVALALWPTWVAVALTETIRKVTTYVLTRPGRELLFTVVSQDEKYKAKMVNGEKGWGVGAVASDSIVVITVASCLAIVAMDVLLVGRGNNGGPFIEIRTGGVLVGSDDTTSLFVGGAAPRIPSPCLAFIGSPSSVFGFSSCAMYRSRFMEISISRARSSLEEMAA
uniref:Saposin B-type domain-containing protein n=1 Tax=Leersia perrieri TaxID=77586 RepID=A0A0D9XW66_9ORYZ